MILQLIEVKQSKAHCSSNTVLQEQLKSVQRHSAEQASAQLLGHLKSPASSHLLAAPLPRVLIPTCWAWIHYPTPCCSLLAARCRCSDTDIQSQTRRPAHSQSTLKRAAAHV